MNSDELAILLQAASEGERTAVVAFLKAFQSADLIVPDKEQSPRFDFLPAYPNRPLNVLAVQDGNNVFVPVFSSAELAEKWSNRKLNVRRIKSCDLIKLLPEDWWIALNPGDEIRKDFSPWELSKIIGNQEELAEVATELEMEYGVEPLLVRKLTSSEFREIRDKLKELFDANLDIKEIFLGIEEGQTVEGSPVETLLLGLRVKDLPSVKTDAIRSNIRDAIAPFLIGSIQLRVLLGVGFSNLELGVFADFPTELTREG